MVFSPQGKRISCQIVRLWLEMLKRLDYSLEVQRDAVGSLDSLEVVLREEAGSIWVRRLCTFPRLSL